MKTKPGDKTVKKTTVKKPKKESVVKKMVKKIMTSETTTTDIVKEQLPIAVAKGELSINVQQPVSIIVPTAEKKTLNQETESIPPAPKPVAKPVLQSPTRQKTAPLRSKPKMKKNPVFPGQVKILIPRSLKLV